MANLVTSNEVVLGEKKKGGGSVSIKQRHGFRDHYRNISGKSADFTCISSGEEIKMSLSIKVHGSHLGFLKKMEHFTSSEPLEEQLW
jgi:hypothetical protein